jgi:pSer/pThr/pTyr-binding forkhead associated (FHA) protein
MRGAMDLFTSARRLEARIARKFDAAARRVEGSTRRSPLEVLHAVTDVVEQEIVPAGRGRRIFPYNALTVVLAADSGEDRARYEALLDSAPSLRERLHERIRSHGADPSDLEVVVTYAAEADSSWRAPEFHVELARVTRAVEVVAVKEPSRPCIELTIVRGAATEPTYSLTAARIDLGRGAEVRDTSGRLLRTNHVVFTEGVDDINPSVSRRHAHITCDDGGAYRIHDDGSAQGTSVLRDGASILVRGGSRGVRLRAGDEIVLGEARLRVSFGE